MRIWRQHRRSTWATFRGQGAKLSNGLQNRKWSTWITLSKTLNLSEIGWTVVTKSRPKHDQNWIRLWDSCRPEEDYAVISNRNVKTIEVYIVANVELASSSSFRDLPKWLFCDGKVGDGSGVMNAICSRPEVADDVICSASRNMSVWICALLASVVYEKIEVSHLCNA